MEPFEDRFTPTLDAARKRRMQLHDSLVEVEEAISSPAPGRIEQWCQAVSKTLLRLRDSFDEHVLGTEAEEGLYDEILDRAPRLANKVDRLRAEHEVIRASLDGLIDSLSAGELETEDEITEARDSIQKALGMIVHHRQLGADLVWDAYNLDIGSPG